MHAIARHSFVSLIAFALSRVLGLAIVGLVVAEYGLAAYGLLMLVRVFLPQQLLGVFCVGLPETVMRAIARDLASDRARAALQIYLAALLVVGCIGLLLALPLILAAGPIATFAFNLNASDAALIAPAIVAHGAALPLLFLDVMAESALRGQERFKVLRSTELLTNLAYGLISLLLIHLDAGLVAIALAYLGSQVLRAVAAIALAHRGFAPAVRTGARPSFALLLQERAYLRAQIARRLGTTVTGQVPRLAISHFLGPAAVGLYEALLRIPSVLRSLITVINSVVMPVVVRIGTAGQREELAQIAVEGPRLLLAMASLITLPPISLAEPLLDLWLGPEVAAYWPWFIALCATTFFQATAGFWRAMGAADLATLRQQNRVGRFQAVIVLVVAFGLIHSLGTAAFWLALLCSMAYAFPALALLAARRHGIAPLRLVAPVGLVLAVSVPAALTGFLMQQGWAIDDWLRLLSALAIVAAVQVLALGLFVIRPHERRTLLRWGRG